MSEQIAIMGRVIDLKPLGGLDWRTRKRLIEANLRTVLSLSRFSASENLLYCLAKHDGYLRIVFLAPASARSIRKAQRQRHQIRNQKLPTTSLKEILTHARSEAAGLSHDHVSGEHLLLALLRSDPEGAAVLGEYGLTYDRARQIVAERGIAGYHRNLTCSRPTFWSGKVT